MLPVPVAPDRRRVAALLVLGLAAIVALSVALLIGRPEPAPAPFAHPSASELRDAIRVAAPAPKPAPEPLLEIKRILDVPAIAFGDWKWDETGAPATGRIVMTVDVDAQTISVFRGGHEIGTAAVLYGADEKPTPLGRFPVLEKDADHVSNLYDAPMPYMLRLTGDGVAIHGSRIEEGYATHGCIGVPTPFAKKLFGVVKLGDVAVITKGRLLKVGDRIA